MWGAPCQQQHWVGGFPVVLVGRDLGEASRGRKGDKEGQCFLRVRSRETQRDYRYGVREEGPGGLHVLREGAGSPPFLLPNQFAHIHQRRKTVSLIFQILISLRLKWSTNNNYTGNTSVETAPGKPGQVTTSRGTSSSSLLLQEAFLGASPPHVTLLPGPLVALRPIRPCPWQLMRSEVLNPKGPEAWAVVTSSEACSE